MKASAVFPIVAGIAGFLVVYLSKVSVPPGYAPYLSLAALAGLDAVFGGIRSGLEGKFSDNIFLSGFLINTVLSAFLAWLGDRIGVDLFLAAVVLLGGRIFLNLSLVRRFWLVQLQAARKKDS